MLIGLVGLINSGKGTVAHYLGSHYNFTEYSFASNVKDMLSSMFGWERSLLEGDTEESRIWRESVDEWWSEKLGIKDFTPRYAMQNIGTDVIRKHFNDNIWILGVANKVRLNPDKNIVVSDVRFLNEAAFIKEEGGVLLEIIRGTRPDWWSWSTKYDLKIADERSVVEEIMLNKYPNVHSSEWASAGIKVDFIINNSSDLDTLQTRIDHFINTLI